MMSASRLCTCALALSALLLASCGGGGTDASSSPAAQPVILPVVVPGVVVAPPLLANLKGTILDGAGVPVAGATVLADGTSTLTVADGSFALATPQSASTTMVLVEKAGYTLNAKLAPVLKGVVTQIDIRLFADQTTATFAASAGGTLTAGSATLTIVPNSLLTAAGATYTGTVSAAFSAYDPQTLAGTQALQQPGTTTDAGSPTLAHLLATIDFKLFDAAGNPLLLDPAAPASVALSRNSLPSFVGTLRMLNYAETSKQWVTDAAGVTTTSLSRTGQARATGVWGIGTASPLATQITGCFRDPAGRPVGGLNALVQGFGWSAPFATLGDAAGNFAVSVPAAIDLSLAPWYTSASFNALSIPNLNTTPLQPGETRQLPCIVVPAALATPAAVTVPAATSSFSASTGAGTASFAGAYAGTFGGSITGTFTVSVLASGTIDGTATDTATSDKYTIAGGVDSGGGVRYTLTSPIGNRGNGTASINSAGDVGGPWNSPFYRGLFAGRRQ
jgi:hypothetical protein